MFVTEIVGKGMNEFEFDLNNVYLNNVYLKL